MSGVTELIAWLRACLDDDERMWSELLGAGAQITLVEHHFTEGIRGMQKRMLAEVETKRRILDRYEDTLARQADPEHSQVAAHVQTQEYENWIIPQLAQPYAGRNGWREAWRLGVSWTSEETQ